MRVIGNGRSLECIEQGLPCPKPPIERTKSTPRVGDVPLEMGRMMLLPNELLKEIFGRLSLKDQAAARLCCRRFHAVTSDLQPAKMRIWIEQLFACAGASQCQYSSQDVEKALEQISSHKVSPVDYFLQLLGSNDEMQRVKAITALGQLSFRARAVKEKIVSGIVGSLRDSNDTVRRTAATILGVCRVVMREALRKAVKDDDPDKGENALGIFEEVSCWKKRDIQAIQSCLNAPDISLRSKATTVLMGRRSRHPEVKTKVYEALLTLAQLEGEAFTNEMFFRVAAIENIGHLGFCDQRGLDILLEQFSRSPDVETTIALMETLGKLVYRSKNSGYRSQVLNKLRDIYIHPWEQGIRDAKRWAIYQCSRF